MGDKENLSRISVNIFDDGQNFDRFLHANNMGSGYGARAKGLKRQNGELVVAIDKSYYLSGGIRESQLPAIIEHERIELTSISTDPHLEATMGEYRYIKEQFGPEGLREYHTNLCNLMGGPNDIRTTALKKILG